MTQANLNPVALAKKGDAKAISFLISRSLKAEHITAKSIISDKCLKIIVESSEVPECQTIVPLIYQGIQRLAVESVETVKIGGRKLGSSTLSWSRELSLVEQFEHLDEIDTDRSVVQKDIELVLDRNISSTEVPLSDSILVSCKGDGGVFEVFETHVVVRRKGGFLSVHKKGEKNIPYQSIVNFQYKRSTFVSPGYIYIATAGLDEEINYWEAASNENALIFQNSYSSDFDKANSIISSKITIRDPEKHKNRFVGKNGTILLTNTGVLIRRVGGLLSSFPAGEKTIPYKSITAVQFKKPTMTVGFLQLTLVGAVEASGGSFQAVTDENTVTFETEESAESFGRAKIMIEERISQIASGKPETDNSDYLVQLEKLATLKDKGIISDIEFDAKKKQLLGI